MSLLMRPYRRKVCFQESTALDAEGGVGMLQGRKLCRVTTGLVLALYCGSSAWLKRVSFFRRRHSTLTENVTLNEKKSKQRDCINFYPGLQLDKAINERQKNLAFPWTFQFTNLRKDTKRINSRTVPIDKWKHGAERRKAAVSYL